MSTPVADVIVAVHSRTRPIARAVASVVDHTNSPARVSVVAHNIDPGIIRANLGGYADHPAVRLLPFRDDIPSPAGPMNHGLDQATARFTALLGSDDELAPGAIDSWLALQQATGATMIVPRVLIVGRATATLPPIRGGSRSRRLRASRDRLSYRSAPLGLISRTSHGHLRFTEGVMSGEDIPYTAQLWFTARDLAADVSGPGYLVHEDGTDRISGAMRSVADDFAFLDAIDATPWFAALRRQDRVAIVSKLLRIQFLGAITSRRAEIATHAHELHAVLDRLRSMAPGAFGLLSRVDRKIIDEAFSAGADPERILELAHERWNARSLGVIVTRNPLRSLHSQAMLRLLRDARRVPVE